MTKINRSPIETNHAIIHTVTVDVKILRLDKKQMTLSVFRQLPESNIFVIDRQVVDGRYSIVALALCGIPWGTVNYKWSGSMDWASRYLVWSDTKKLYRMPLVDSPFKCIQESYSRCSNCNTLRLYNKPLWCEHCQQRKLSQDIETVKVPTGCYNSFTVYALGNQYKRISDYEEAKELSKAMYCLIAAMKQFDQLDQLFIAV